MAKEIGSYVKKRLDFSNLSSSRRLLCLLDERGALSQPEAAALLAMSAGSCNLHFQRLEHEGLIGRVDKRSEGRGRPTLIWDVDRSRNACITLVFDVPFFRAALCDFSGTVIEEFREDLTGVSDQAALLKRISECIRSAQQTMAARGGTIRQLYAALPGLLDPRSGEVVSAVNLPVLNGLNLKQALEKRFRIPCHAGSLGPAFYYGELEHWPQDRVTLLIHWDLGVGFVFGQGRRILTLHANADGESPLISELGHVRVAREGHPCHCGQQGCLEAYVGGWAILKSIANPQVSTLPQLVDAVHAGDREALAETRKAARFLGRHLAWPLQLMKVQHIVISGPFAPALPPATAAFQRGLGTLFTPQEVDRLSIRISEDPETQVQRGAYTLAKRLYLYPDEYQSVPGPSTGPEPGP
jgi:predicted NBD/HSP70 family sugar kinase